MDLEQKAIERIKTASEMSLEYYKQPLICTYSGGKDSDVLLELFKRFRHRSEAYNLLVWQMLPRFFARNDQERIKGNEGWDMQKITKCPYCGSDRGMFAKFKANGTDTYSFDGKMESSEVMDYFSYNKTMRCMDCSKRIMSYEEFKRDYYVED